MGYMKPALEEEEEKRNTRITCGLVGKHYSSADNPWSLSTQGPGAGLQKALSPES